MDSEQSVDVLKVLSRASVKLEFGHGIESMNLAIEVSEARAAVAELIEAADALVNYRSADHDDMSLMDNEPVWERAEKAIANIGGAA